MDSTKDIRNQPNPIYEDFEPSTTWERNPNVDTLILHLPGFKKEQLKVQVTSTNKLRITGESPLGDNKRGRFRKEFLIASNYEANAISARFAGGALRIEHPKIITPAAEAKAPTEALKRQKLESDYSKDQKKGGEKATAQEADSSKTNSMKKQPSKGVSGVGSASADVAKTASWKSSEQITSSQKADDPSKTTTIEKQSSKGVNGFGSASPDAPEIASRETPKQITSQEADGPSKTTSVEKQPSKSDNWVTSASADVPKTASRKSSDKESTEDHLAEEGKTTSGDATMEKEENRGDAAAERAEKEAAGSSNGSGDKFRLEEMKQALSGLVMEMNQRKKFMNMIVVVLLVLVAWIYVRNAIGSIGKSKN